jgi:hypothetical protein
MVSTRIETSNPKYLTYNLYLNPPKSQNHPTMERTHNKKEDEYHQNPFPNVLGMFQIRLDEITSPKQLLVVLELDSLKVPRIIVS